MISKELLSEVLEIHSLIKVIDIKVIKNKVTWINSEIPKSVYDETRGINIYELAYKCKEWAYKNGYIINTAIEPLTHKASWQFDLYKLRYEKIDMINNIPPSQHFIITKSYDTEPEAIFKATQYILENKDK